MRHGNVVQVSYADDVYRLSFGVRTVQVNSSQILINSRPFYCLGVGKHEDCDVSYYVCLFNVWCVVIVMMKHIVSMYCTDSVLILLTVQPVLGES